MTEFDAFILIGGRSTRLGSDKALVELGGKTLVERAVGTIRAGLSPERTTLVAGNSTQLVINAIAVDAPFIFDLQEDRGPLGGLHAALAYAQSPWIFLLACDYPFVSPELIALLADAVSDEFGAILPEQKDGRHQPLCAFYNVAKALPVVDEIIALPRVPPPMHEVAARIDPCFVRFNEYSHLSNAAVFFTNINTPEDLEHARSACKL